MVANAYEYLSKCFSTCPVSTYTIEYLTKCVEICPNSTYIIEHKCEKCHPDCAACEGPFNDNNSNCTSCLSPDKYLENGNYKTNSYTMNEIYVSTINEITTELIPDITTDKEKDITDMTTDIFKKITTEIIAYIETKVHNKDKYMNIASAYNTTNNTLIYNII